MSFMCAGSIDFSHDTLGKDCLQSTDTEGVEAKDGGPLVLLTQQMILGHLGKQRLKEESKILSPGPPQCECSTLGHSRD